MRMVLAIATFVAYTACTQNALTSLSRSPDREVAADNTFAGVASTVMHTLESSVFVSPGYWTICESGCGGSNHDWGADSLTYVAALRWRISHDASVVPLMRSLERTAMTYAQCDVHACTWSDVPEWDSIADSREYQITGNTTTLGKAEAAYAYVRNSHLFALGACPDIHYQHPFGATGLKTLETDANAVKAAMLLYHETGRRVYLRDAQRLYAAIRMHFLDARVPLYTVYVVDNATTCSQIPRRFFASVNGDMISNGLSLYAATHNAAYLRDARATAGAVETDLHDGRGVYADLQAENDVVEPLVEAMYELATLAHNTAARAWIITNAQAALQQDRDARGWYGRFFDGYAPTWNVTAWQSNGGFALAVAAAAVAPDSVPAPNFWTRMMFVPLSISTLPSPVVAFTGRAVAFVGNIGDRCCEAGHATVLLDGVPTFNWTGIWQNKSSAEKTIPGAVLFAWSWPAPGKHTVQFGPGQFNVKEGGPYLHLIGYYLVR